MLKVGLLYFAYGCNMNARALAEVVGMELAPGWGARLDAWRLAFNKREDDGSLVANLIESPGCVTYGVVYRLPREALRPLDAFERYPDEYRRETFWVEPIGRSARQAAVSYVAEDEWTSGDGAPNVDYLDLLIGGARTHGLPAAYVKWLASAAAGEASGCFAD